MNCSSDFELFGLPAALRAGPRRHRRALEGTAARGPPRPFAAQGAAAQRVAMQWSVRINEAYQRLKDPLKRAAYLCELRGAPIDAENNTAMPAEFLMEQMEWREALDEARGEADARRAARRSWTPRRDELLARIEQLLDEEGDAPAAAQQVRALMFIERFAQDVEAALRATGTIARLMRHVPAPDFRTRPGARPAPAPHRGRHRPRHHPFAGGRRAQRRGRMPARRAGPRAAAFGGALPRRTAAARSATTRRPRRPRIPRTPSPRSSASWAAAWPTSPTATSCPTASSTSRGMVTLQTRAGEKSPVEVSAEILATLRYRAEDTFNDDLYGAVITVPAYFDEAPAPGHQGRRAAGRPQRAAPDQRADGRRHRLRPGQRQRRRLRRLRPGRRHLRHLHPAPDAGRVRGGRHRRRFGAGRRRLRPRAGRLAAAAGRPAGRQTPRDKAAIKMAARAAKEQLSDDGQPSRARWRWAAARVDVARHARRVRGGHRAT